MLKKIFNSISIFLYINLFIFSGCFPFLASDINEVESCLKDLKKIEFTCNSEEYNDIFADLVKISMTKKQINYGCIFSEEDRRIEYPGYSENKNIYDPKGISVLDSHENIRVYDPEDKDNIFSIFSIFSTFVKAQRRCLQLEMMLKDRKCFEHIRLDEKYRIESNRESLIDKYLIKVKEYAEEKGKFYRDSDHIIKEKNSRIFKLINEKNIIYSDHVKLRYEFPLEMKKIHEFNKKYISEAEKYLANPSEASLLHIINLRKSLRQYDQGIIFKNTEFILNKVEKFLYINKYIEEERYGYLYPGKPEETKSKEIVSDQSSKKNMNSENPISSPNTQNNLRKRLERAKAKGPNKLDQRSEQELIEAQEFAKKSEEALLKELEEEKSKKPNKGSVSKGGKKGKSKQKKGKGGKTSRTSPLNIEKKEAKVFERKTLEIVKVQVPKGNNKVSIGGSPISLKKSAGAPTFKPTPVPKDKRRKLNDQISTKAVQSLLQTKNPQQKGSAGITTTTTMLPSLSTAVATNVSIDPLEGIRQNWDNKPKSQIVKLQKESSTTMLLEVKKVSDSQVSQSKDLEANMGNIPSRNADSSLPIRILKREKYEASIGQNNDVEKVESTLKGQLLKDSGMNSDTIKVEDDNIHKNPLQNQVNHVKKKKDIRGAIKEKIGKNKKEQDADSLRKKETNGPIFGPVIPNPAARSLYGKIMPHFISSSVPLPCPWIPKTVYVPIPVPVANQPQAEVGSWRPYTQVLQDGPNIIFSQTSGTYNNSRVHVISPNADEIGRENNKLLKKLTRLQSTFRKCFGDDQTMNSFVNAQLNYRMGRGAVPIIYHGGIIGFQEQKRLILEITRMEEFLKEKGFTENKEGNWEAK